MRIPRSPTPPRTRRDTGFALVITLTLMVMLTIIAVGLLGLSAVSLRSGTQLMLQQEARANARLAMMMAIGSLQKLAGPDQRITAPSDILDPTPDSSGNDGVLRPHLTGVWKGWRHDASDGPANYGQRKQDDFLGWLVSTADTRAAGERSLIESAAAGDAAILVGSGSSTDPAGYVRAEKVPLGSAGMTGAFAWAILDQGQKAFVPLPDDPPSNMAERLAELSAPAVPAFGKVSSREWSALTQNPDERMKLITHKQFRLGGVEPDASSFHDLTSDSLGLPVDVTDGGFSKDLSLLFDGASLPADYSRRFLFSDSDTPLSGPPARFQGANPLPSPDPSWLLLQSHARLFRSVTKPTTSPTIRLAADPRPPSGSAANSLLYDPAFTRQQLAPVIARAQFIFSIGFGASPEQAKGQKAPGAQTGEDWICWLVTDPVVTLWNPYDVNLTFTDGMIELYRVPLAYQLFRNGTSYAPPTLFASSFLAGEWNTRAKRYYRLNLLPKVGEATITMKPGEHLVLTAHNHVKHYQEAYYTTGVDLRPGWNEPAGESSNQYTGGISTLNTYVGSTSSANTGSINGASARSLPVKAGDRITLKVTPAKAEVDKFAETNNQEITAMLRYRINPGTGATSPGSLPPLVGAIELDYGSRETKLLETFDQRDLPSIVVPAGIPKNEQGDGYVGTKPPPAVRYKEPFLVTSLHLKTALDSRFPSRGWLQNSPTNLYSSSGIDQTEDFQNHQYEFNWEPMTDWKSSPTIEIDTKNRGFGGSGIYSQTGQTNAVFASVPLAPLLSIAQLRHAPLNHGGQLPLQAQVVANSFASPLLGPDAVKSAASSGRTFLDQSWLANQALFDRYFFSGAASSDTSLGASSKSAAKVIEGFIKDGTPLANPRMRPLPDATAEADPAAIADSADNYKEFPARLGIAGAFNINSTSVAAWQAILSSLQQNKPPSINAPLGTLGETSGDGTLVSRHVPPVGDAFDGVTDPLESDLLTWTGHRRLTDSQMESLANGIVAQIKKRGPFQSLSEFVNRRLESGDLATSGALQSAIDASGINKDAVANAVVIPAMPAPPANPVAPANPAAAVGSTADGAPAVINQADLLTSLAPIASARSDTFLVRTYGEARSGDSVYRAWCEAVVQRLPDYIDESTPRTAAPATLPADSANARFGRRFAIVSFRWLSQDAV